MTDDRLFLATVLLLLLALAGVLTGWLRASARADRAEDTLRRATERDAAETAHFNTIPRATVYRSHASALRRVR